MQRAAIYTADFPKYNLKTSNNKAGQDMRTHDSAGKKARERQQAQKSGRAAQDFHKWLWKIEKFCTWKSRGVST